MSQRPQNFLYFLRLLLTLTLLCRNSTATNLFEKHLDDSLLWGPYRSNLYFGVRPRTAKSLFSGLLWSRVDNYGSFSDNLRHTCEQNENMSGYGWDEYDIRAGGRQIIHDTGNEIDISTEFAKFPGGANGGGWGARIKGKPREGVSPSVNTTVIFYVANEGDSSLNVGNMKAFNGHEGSVEISGFVPVLGDFTIEIKKGNGAHPTGTHASFIDNPLENTMVHSFQILGNELWQMKNVLLNHINDNINSYSKKYGEANMPPPSQIFTISNNRMPGNLQVIQKVFQGAFEFDILYSSASSTISSDMLSNKINSNSKAFATRHSEIFMPQTPFTNKKYAEFSKSLFSNLVGGIGYFHGDVIVDRSYAEYSDEEDEMFWVEEAEIRSRNLQKFEGPHELFTSVPSRTFFPRGFLWDEGFHLLPVMDWDPDLCLDIIKSWLNMMDENGWIAREQILGMEARSKVPPEFQIQYSHHANPPTLFMLISVFLDKVKTALPSKLGSNWHVETQGDTRISENAEMALNYLRQLYPLLKKNYFWYRKTQHGDVNNFERPFFSTKEAYRWRGRTPQHILTSGMDDYPRAQPPHPGELHVDLISWMGMMTRSIKDVADAIGEEHDADQFAAYEKAILHNIDKLHWSDEHKMYCDSTIDEYEEFVQVCHKGYVSILPFLLDLVAENSDRLRHFLDMIGNEDELWSPFGIRSLSKADEFYFTQENYWRGPIWINLNYLVLVRLQELGQSPGQYQKRSRKMYNDLRQNLVETVYNSWKETGFAWEQYNPETGKGQRTQHFTGWTSLVVKILSMPDLPLDNTKDEL